VPDCSLPPEKPAGRKHPLRSGKNNLVILGVEAPGRQGTKWPKFEIPNFRIFDLICGLDNAIWNLFVFRCLYLGIWHYFRRAGKPFNLKPNPTLPMVSVMFSGLKYQTAVDNG
jgi:hypothetical protein